MLKHWRVLILLVMLLGAVLSIGLKLYPYGRYGVEIVYITDDSPARDVIENGMQITELNGERIENSEDWNRRISNLTGNISLRANGEIYEIEIVDILGIDVMDIERTNLEFGLDLRGGTRIILTPENVTDKETMDQILATLQTRANLYGLKEIKFYSIKGERSYIQVEATGLGSEVVNQLLSTQGKFEAKVGKPVTINDNKGNFILGDRSYPVTYNNGTVEINNSLIQSNDTFTLEGILFQYLNKTDDKLIFLGTVYEGEDIELVYTDPQRSGIVPRGGGYNFYFVVLVSQDGAQRFADVTTGIPKILDIEIGEEYLDSNIYLFLDNKLVSSLRIGESLGGEVYTTPQIQGSRLNMEDAIEEKLRLQTILRSGALPTKLETVSVDIISPTLGKGFFSSTLYAGLFAGIAVIIIIFLRYRSIKLALPLVFIGLSEVLIILGIAATNDSFIWGTVMVVNASIAILAWWKKQEMDIYAWAGVIIIPLLGMLSWTIDLPTIGGIIAAIGTGVDHQIIIADEVVIGRKIEEKIFFSMKEKIKSAFFIIFGAAATTIAAMVPLVFLGIGLVRGFAITTMIGVLVGILITRPAYAKIVEVLFK